MKKKVLILIICIFLMLTGCRNSNNIATSTFVMNEGSPDTSISAVDGSVYLDTNTYDVYKKVEEQWDFVGNIAGSNGEDGTVSDIYVNDEGFVVINGVVSNTKINVNNGTSGEDGNNGKDGSNGKDGIKPELRSSEDGYLVVNNTKTSMKVNDSNKACSFYADTDKNFEFSIGDEVKCGSEHFYIVDYNDEELILFAKYNLDVGNIYDNNTKKLVAIENPTGIQSEKAKAFDSGAENRYGTIEYASELYWDNGTIKPRYGEAYPGDIYDSNASIFNYLQNYKYKLKEMGVSVLKTRLITLKELNNLGCESELGTCKNTENKWLLNTSFWSGTAANAGEVWRVNNDGFMSYYDATVSRGLGARPVIEISREDFSDDKLYETQNALKHCIYDGKMVQGNEFVQGQYTYRYKEGYDIVDGAIKVVPISTDGWSVRLTDPSSTEPVTSNICETINGKPIASTSLMYYNSHAPSIDLSSFNTSNVTDMSGMFYLSKATTLDLSNFDTSKVTDMSHMFNGSNATTLDLSSFNTSKVTDMSDMFSYSSATTLDLSSFDTSNVTDMGHMFSASHAITLNLSSFDTSKVTDMSGMFRYSQATSLNLSNFDTSKVTDMTHMFSYSSATTLDLSSFDTSNVIIMNSMFRDSEATTLDLSSFDTSKVTDMSHMFNGSNAITLNLSSFDTSKVTDMSEMFYSSQAMTLNLSSFDTSNVTNMSFMFYSSQAITLNLSSFDTSNVTDMSGMFRDSEATTLDLSSFDTSKVTDMSGMFSYSSATTLDLSSFDTSKVTDMSSMFRGSHAMTLDLSSFDTSNVTNMRYMFNGSQATTGYARTQSDADKFNSSSHKPSWLVFEVKE